jgi:hypothetical protein
VGEERNTFFGSWGGGSNQLNCSKTVLGWGGAAGSFADLVGLGGGSKHHLVWEGGGAKCSTASDVLNQARAELARLYPSGPSPYVAVHMRLGGLTGEEGVPGVDRGLSPLPNFIAGIRCGVKLANSRHISLTATPALVITDNHYLRQRLHDNLLRDVVAPGGLPVHLDRAEGQSLEAHRNAIVDLVLLGWSECLVTSRSGFSLHAWLYGGAKECTISQFVLIRHVMW